MKFLYLILLILNLNDYEDLRANTIDEKIEVCNSCHSVDNLKEDPLVPSIQGQEFFYIYTQLKDYKAGRRKHDVMSGISSELSKQDMKDLSQHYSEKKWLSFPLHLKYEPKNAESIVSSGGRNACTKCHIGFKGNSGVPTIGGQKWTYLNQTMKAFKDKLRTNAATKNAIFSGFDYETIELMAKYISEQKQ